MLSALSLFPSPSQQVGGSQHRQSDHSDRGRLQGPATVPEARPVKRQEDEEQLRSRAASRCEAHLATGVEKARPHRVTGTAPCGRQLLPHSPACREGRSGTGTARGGQRNTRNPCRHMKEHSSQVTFISKSYHPHRKYFGMSVFVAWRVVFYYVAQAVFKLTGVLLPQPPESWAYKRAPLCPTLAHLTVTQQYFHIGSHLQTLLLFNKHDFACSVYSQDVSLYTLTRSLWLFLPSSNFILI